MSERDDLAVRADVLSKLADQLGEQLAVERKANDELRAILRDGPTGMNRGDDGVVCVAPVATTLAAVAVGMSLCAAVAASWIGGGAGQGCPARDVSLAATTSSVASAGATLVPPPPPVAWTVAGPVPQAPPPADGLREDGASPNPRDCGRIVNASAARCFVEATGGDASGEYLLRNLILAYTLLGDRGSARIRATRYFHDYGTSPFALQIRQLGYQP